MYTAYLDIWHGINQQMVTQGSGLAAGVLPGTRMCLVGGRYRCKHYSRTTKGKDKRCKRNIESRSSALFRLGKTEEVVLERSELCWIKSGLRHRLEVGYGLF